MREISATDISRSISDYLSKVQYQRESFQITRNGEPIACLVPLPAADAPILTLRGLLEMLRGLGTDEQFGEDLLRIQAEQPPLPETPWQS